jgi:hypothetical protein
MMAVIAHYELPRNSDFRFGDSPVFERRFVCTVDDPGTTTLAQVAQAVQVDIGSPHPEYLGLPCVEAEINEAYDESRYHIEFIARYEFSKDLVANKNPLLRPDTWSFETQGVAVPAFYYYDKDLNNVSRLPLTNSAYDYFEGLTVDEAQTRVVISGYRKNFPSNLAIALTNTINNFPWLGGEKHTWKCMGIAGESAQEIVGTSIIDYWKFTTTLMYRQSGWDLLLPDMGFNYLIAGQKRRVMTFDFENSEWIPSPVPMGLDGFGNQTFGAPAILTRRIFREVNFNFYFGNPPA